MDYKVTFVEAHFKPIGKYETIRVPTGEKGIFGIEKTREEKRWVQTGYSDSEIDGERLTKDVQSAIDELTSSGYEIIGVMPVTSGRYSWKYRDAAYISYGYGYGYSYTEGVMILSRRTY